MSQDNTDKIIPVMNNPVANFWLKVILNLHEESPGIQSLDDIDRMNCLKTEITKIVGETNDINVHLTDMKGLLLYLDIISEDLINSYFH